MEVRHAWRGVRSDDMSYMSKHVFYGSTIEASSQTQMPAFGGSPMYSWVGNQSSFRKGWMQNVKVRQNSEKDILSQSPMFFS